VSGTTQFSASYTRDAGGRITSKTETVLGTTSTYEYTYDTAGRLTQVKKDGTVVSTYTYDSNSNRLSYTPQGGSAINGTYDNQDRLTQYGSKTYSYTANGELSQKVDGSQTTTYSYDVLGNLKTVTLPSGTSITYVIARQGVREIWDKTRRERREYGGKICRRKDGNTFFTPPNRGEEKSVKTGSCPTGTENEGYYHTHPNLPGYPTEDFSDMDKQIAANEGKPGYLGTPSGAIKKWHPSPDPNHPEVGATETIGSVRRR
jgi:YD repeat-containing protein